jgi:hypothetical protein
MNLAWPRPYRTAAAAGREGRSALVASGLIRGAARPPRSVLSS